MRSLLIHALLSQQQPVLHMLVLHLSLILHSVQPLSHSASRVIQAVQSSHALSNYRLRLMNVGLKLAITKMCQQQQNICLLSCWLQKNVLIQCSCPWHAIISCCQIFTKDYKVAIGEFVNSPSSPSYTTVYIYYLFCVVILYFVLNCICIVAYLCHNVLCLTLYTHSDMWVSECMLFYTAYSLWHSVSVIMYCV